MKKAFSNILIPIGIGLIIGVVASFGDTVPSNGGTDPLFLLTSYFNTATLWGAAAFIVGVRMGSKKMAAISAILLLLAAVGSYYFYGTNFGNRTEIIMGTIIKTAVLWSIIGIVVGTIFGIAGFVYKHTISSKAKMAGVITLSSLILSENGYYLYAAKDYLTQLDPQKAVLIGMILVGLALPFILLGKNKKGLLSTVLSTLISGGGILFLEQLFKIIRETR